MIQFGNNSGSLAKDSSVVWQEVVHGAMFGRESRPFNQVSIKAAKGPIFGAKGGFGQTLGCSGEKDLKKKVISCDYIMTTVMMNLV